jgi:hypothetical protein
MAQRSFQKWQARAIEQKHNTSSLLLGLSGAALGFSVSLLGKQTGYLGFLESVAFQTHVFAQLISIGAGVAFSTNRVRDFDLTSSIARAREKNPSASSLASMRARVKKFGRITRRLYFTQIVTFIVGALAFLAFVIAHYRHVLYA